MILFVTFLLLSGEAKTLNRGNRIKRQMPGFDQAFAAGKAIMESGANLGKEAIKTATKICEMKAEIASQAIDSAKDVARANLDAKQDMARTAVDGFSKAAGTVFSTGSQIFPK